MSISKCRKASSPPPCHIDSASVRLEPVYQFSHECHIPITIKQVDLDGYDIVPSVPTHYDTYNIPSWCDYTKLHKDVARAVEKQYGFPSRRSDARRDFYFKVSMCYRLKDNEGVDPERMQQTVRITEQNWRALGGLLHCGKVEVAGLSVRWWKKTAAQKKADRSEEGGGAGCCCVM